MQKPILPETYNGEQTQTPADAIPQNRLPVTDPAPDPFDPANLRLSQDFGVGLGVQKILTRVACRKPDKQWFVRVRPGEDWRLDTAILECQADGENYLVAPALHAVLGNEVKLVCLVLATTRQGSPFLWPVNLPKAGGRSNPWNDTAITAMQAAETAWVRVVPNMADGQYDTLKAAAELDEPDWDSITTGLPFTAILRLAFRERFIDRADHPVLQTLRGER